MCRDVKGSEEIPQQRDLYIDSDKILFQVCDYYGVNSEDLHKSRRGHFNEPRSVAVYLLRSLRRDSLNEIGRVLQIEKYSTVSSVLERLKSGLGDDRQLQKRIKELRNRIIKSQGQT